MPDLGSIWPLRSNDPVIRATRWRPISRPCGCSRIWSKPGMGWDPCSDSSAISMAPYAQFTAVTQAAPDVAEAHYNLGLSLWSRYKNATGPRQSSDIEAATTALRTAARLAPADAKVHAALGQLLVDTDDLPGAVESFRRAQALVPDSGEIAYDLGLALRKTGDLARRRGAIAACARRVRGAARHQSRTGAGAAAKRRSRGRGGGLRHGSRNKSRRRAGAAVAGNHLGEAFARR